jgi:hypothetical protein
MLILLRMSAIANFAASILIASPCSVAAQQRLRWFACSHCREASCTATTSQREDNLYHTSRLGETPAHLFDGRWMPCLWLVDRFPDRRHNNGKGQPCIGGRAQMSVAQAHEWQCMSQMCPAGMPSAMTEPYSEAAVPNHYPPTPPMRQLQRMMGSL